MHKDTRHCHLIADIISDCEAQWAFTDHSIRESRDVSKHVGDQVHIRGYLKGTDLHEPPFDHILSDRLKGEKRMECEGLTKRMDHLEDKSRDLKEWSFNT